MTRPGALVSMPHDAGRLINAAPTSTPCSETEVHVFAVCRRKKPVETSKFEELLSIDSHKAAGPKQRVTDLLPPSVEFPTVKTVFELQSRRPTDNHCHIPVVAARRNRKNIRRFKMPNQRSEEIV